MVYSFSGVFFSFIPCFYYGLNEAMKKEKRTNSWFSKSL
jgi:hypothetical protein